MAVSQTGHSTSSSMDRCFPESLQLPPLGSTALQALRDDLTSKVAEALSRRVPTDKQTTGPFADLKLTTNSAVTYTSSGSARTDLFFQYKGTDPLSGPSNEQTNHLLQQAWQEDALDTLKLIAHLRDVRGGKGEQKLFHDCVAWMRDQHPLTLIANLQEIVEVGYWKDLLEIAVRMCVSPEALQQRAQEDMARKQQISDRIYEVKMNVKFPAEREAWRDHPELKKMRKKSFRKHLRKLNTQEEKEAAKAERAKQTAQKSQLIADLIASHKKKKKRASNTENVVKQMAEDDVFRLLHLTVAQLFAQQMQKDLAALKEGNPSCVSLAAKWAPTPARSHDKDTLMAASIAEFLFPASQHQAQGEAYKVYVGRVKALYHKQVLVPLRSCLDVPEVYMSANAWQEVKYTRVPSVCMRNNKLRFEAHDKDRFAKYLGDVRAGKKKIASGALKPHELVSEAMNHVAFMDVRDCMQEDEIEEHLAQSSALGLETMELQWKSYVSNLKESGALSSALAVCDVSGSMSGQPMQVAIALSLLVAEVTAPPFNETVCTFSAQPQLHTVKGETLVQKVDELHRMEWGMNTDLNAVFTLILQRALASNIDPEQMIETLFIFSDMQFDNATTTTVYPDYSGGGEDPYGAMPADDKPSATETNFKVAQAEFAEHGYKLPKVVFWNLRGDADDTAVPVTHREEGTALVSGFSGHLLKLFMAGGDELDKFDPFTVMKAAISAEKYNGWKVVD